MGYYFFLKYISNQEWVQNKKENTIQKNKSEKMVVSQKNNFWFLANFVGYYFQKNIKFHQKKGNKRYISLCVIIFLSD